MKKRQKPKYKYTSRGFKIYGEIKDRYCSEVRVQESSLATDQCVWIFCDNPDPAYSDPSPHLNKQQLSELINILQDALKDLE